MTGRKDSVTFRFMPTSGDDVLGVKVGAGPSGTPCVDLVLPDGTRMQMCPKMAAHLGAALIEYGYIAAQLADYVQTN